MASSANTGSATYTVTHDGGTSNVIVNQKQNGGAWVKLGSWWFDPAQGLPSGNDPRVELLGANDGRVVADGIRLVSAGAQAANIACIHPDHLGSPQKMTDISQALTWDAQFDPFGEEFLIAGSAVQPNRFPGQYADAETGYSYNYFRDYDPTIGRYVQSDPIGLDGGINAYAYVEANPLISVDPDGLQTAIPFPPFVIPRPIPAPLIDPILPMPLPNEKPDVKPDTIPDVHHEPRGRGRYKCTIKCDAHPTSTNPNPNLVNFEPEFVDFELCYGGCPQHVIGYGSGSSEPEAWNNVWDSANSTLPGCYKRHCRGIAGSCKGRKGSKAK